MRLLNWDVNFSKVSQPPQILQKDSGAVRAIIVNSAGHPAYTPRNYKQLAIEGFEWNAVVYACITLIMDDIAGIKWKLYKRRGGRRTEIQDHPILDLLHKPNPDQFFSDYIKTYMGFKLCSGMTYEELCGSADSTEDWQGPLKSVPVEMYVQRPDRMKPIAATTGGNLLSGFQYEVGSSKVRYDPSRIIYRKNFHPTNDYFGFSPMEAGSLTIDTDNAARKWNMSLLQNQAKPAGILFLQGTLEKSEKEYLEKTYAMKYGGPENAGRTIMLEKNDKNDWKQMSLSPVDMDWASSIKMNRVDICTIWKVPPELVGDAAHKTFNSFKEAKKAYMYSTILPHCDDIRGGWNERLCPLFGDNLELDYDRDDIEAIQDDRQTVFDQMTKAFTSGLATANEARSQMGWPPTNDDFGDVRIMSFNDMPINDIGDPSDYQNGPSSLSKARGNMFLFKNPHGSKVPRFKNKCFNLSKAAIPFYGRSIAAQRAVYEKKLTNYFTKAVKGDYGDLARQMKRISNYEYARAIMHNFTHEVYAEWKETLRVAYKQVIPEFGRRTMHEILSKEFKDDGITWGTVVSDYLENYGGSKITSITKTTKNKIMAIIDEGYAAGKTMSQISDDIEAASDDLEGRGATIARTELVGASNYGSLAGAEATGLDLQKGWLAIEDDKTRDDHADADGQFVDIGESFEVGGSAMDYPGDPNGGPAKQ